MVQASSSQWPAKVSWTIVHSKKKHSETTKSFLSVDAKGVEDPSIHEQIQEMGKDLCKNKPDDPRCKQFMKEPDAIEQQEETPQKSTEKPAIEAAAATEVPAATKAPSTESTSEPQPTEASVAATKLPASEVPGETTKNPEALPSQGFEGKKVRYKDGKTMTSDWHDEYKISTTVKRGAAAKNGAWAFHSVSVWVMLCVLTSAF